jgi:hypothetical protein
MPPRWRPGPSTAIKKILSQSSFSQEKIISGKQNQGRVSMIEKPREEKCHECRSYCFRARDPEDKEYGWAFCKFHKCYFPNQQNGMPAGVRSCKNWE